MPARTFKNSVNNVLIISSIYDKIEKLESAAKLSEFYDLTIFNGNISYPFSKDTEKRIKLMDKLLENNKIVYNIGDYDYLLSQTETVIQDWIKDKPNIIIIEFTRGSSLLVTNGGITPTMRKEDFSNNIESTFVDNVNQNSWHHSYNGRFGYVISNKPLTEGEPNFFSYSARIGNIYHPESSVYAQEADCNGLQRTILV